MTSELKCKLNSATYSFYYIVSQHRLNPQDSMIHIVKYEIPRSMVPFYTDDWKKMANSVRDLFTELDGIMDKNEVAHYIVDEAEKLGKKDYEEYEERKKRNECKT